MGKFLKEIGFFFTLVFVVCVVVFGFQTWNIRKQADFKFKKDYKYVQLGHSHPECAYNDTLIANFKNLATSGESYFYTFYKLKMILEQNEDIETILLEFTNNQIDVRRDSWIWGDDYISRFYPMYGSFFDSEDIALLMRHNSNSVFNSFSLLQKRNLWMFLSNDYHIVDRIGGYRYYTENDIEKHLIKQRNRIEIMDDEHWKLVSETNLIYLEKIVALCKSYNQKLIFIRSPQHAAMSSRKNEIKFLEIYAEKFSDIPMLDFNDFKIPDTYFKDLAHLNFKGARIISKTLDSLLVQGITDDIFKRNNRRVIFSN